MNNSAVLYSFGLYVLYVLLPIVPAVILFKMFPDTKVAVSGPLQNLTLNATGAFAAYVVTVALGYFVVQIIKDQIDELNVAKVWTISVPIQLQGSDRKIISGGGRITLDTEFDFDQPLYHESGDLIYISVPIVGADWRTIWVSKHGFQPASVPLQALMEKHDPTKVDIKQAARTISVLEPLVLTQVSAAPYAETAPPLTEKSLAELQSVP